MAVHLIKKFSVGVVLIAKWLVLPVLWLSALPSALAAEPASPAASPVYDYAKPKLLTGILYAIGSDRKVILYTFRRTAVRSNSVVYVERQFLSTNGTVATVENVLYESNQLFSFEMQDFQARVSGAIRIEPDPKNPARQNIFISYAHGLHPPKGRARTLQPDTVIDDTLYPFMMTHWDDLMQGKTVRFHFVSLDWERTFEFDLMKTGDSVQNHQPVAQITMKPASIFISRLVKPLIFTVQENNTRRILSYIGRTTPRVKKGNSWKYLDAETVFDYQATDVRK